MSGAMLFWPTVYLWQSKKSMYLLETINCNDWIYYVMAFSSVIPTQVITLSLSLSRWLTTRKFSLSDPSLISGREIR